MSEINGHEYQLLKIFSSDFEYHIPAYQRPYAWTTEEIYMRYRIEYADGRCCNFANSREDLLNWLKLLKDEKIADIRKVYKSGVSDSVLEKYIRYLRQ